MRNNEILRIVRGSQKYIGAQDKDLMLPYTLESKTKTLIEGDRNLVLNLQDQYIREREESSTYRLYGKINPLVSNLLSGCSYELNTFIENSLYYAPIPATSAETLACGYPSMDFFGFIPPTALTSSHNYSEVNAYQDNWVIYESYIKSSDSLQPMEHRVISAETGTGDSYNVLGVFFDSGDGIPFYCKNVTIQGKSAVQFICPVEHGLSENEYIVLQTGTTVGPIGATNQVTTLNNSTQLPIFSFGDEFANTEGKIFNILLQDSTQTINEYDMGVFKRLIDPNNINETLSTYYVHSHELLTKPSSYNLDTTGFELGIYSRKQKNFPGRISPPNGREHIVVREQFPSYLWNFNNNLDVSNYTDNLGRPLMDLYLSVFVVNEPRLWKTKEGCPVGMGWDWNFVPNGIEDPYPNNNIEPKLTTPWNLPQSGDTFIGAFVEYNEWDLTERILSEAYHKLTLNSTDTNGFSFYEEQIEVDGVTEGGPGVEIKGGYYYKPHNRIPIRKQSEAVTVHNNFEFVDEYATFSMYEGLFRWREILPIGFYESETNGVDYPFVNGAHYPYTNLIFDIKPLLIDKDYTSLPTLTRPSYDDCE